MKNFSKTLLSIFIEAGLNLFIGLLFFIQLTVLYFVVLNTLIEQSPSLLIFFPIVAGYSIAFSEALNAEFMSCYQYMKDKSNLNISIKNDILMLLYFICAFLFSMWGHFKIGFFVWYNSFIMIVVISFALYVIKKHYGKKANNLISYIAGALFFISIFATDIWKESQVVFFHIFNFVILFLFFCLRLNISRRNKAKSW